MLPGIIDHYNEIMHKLLYGACMRTHFKDANLLDILDITYSLMIDNH